MGTKPKLSEQQKIACIEELVTRRKLTPREANVYIWNVYGHPQMGRLSHKRIAPLVNLKPENGERQVRRIFAITKPVVLEGLARKERECLEAMKALQIREGLDEDTARLYFGITRQFGHDAHTTDDYIPKLVIDPRREEDGMPEHAGEEQTEQLRVQQGRSAERQRTVEQMREREGKRAA